MVQNTTQSAVETPLPLLHNETEEGHTMMEINHLKSHSKPEPHDIFINFKNNGQDFTNSEIKRRAIKKYSQLG